MKQFKSIDLAKFICAILIIILHTAPFSNYSGILSFGFRNVITVIAVPFFFTASGFLCFRKVETLQDTKDKNRYVFSYLKRLLFMYLIWSAVYFVFVVINWTRDDFGIFSVLEYIKDFFFEGSYSTIWFLPALLTAVLIVYFLSKKLTYKQIFIIACFIYIFTLGGSSYYGLVSKNSFIKQIYDVYYSFFDTIKNGVCFGLIFVSIGGMLAVNNEEGAKFSLRSLIPIFCFAVLHTIEEFLIAKFNFNIKGVDTVIFLVPLTYFLFKFILALEIKISDKCCTLFRKYSILMFLTQRIPLSIIDLFLQGTVFANNSIIYFLAVLIATLVISYVIILLSKKFKFIKYAF